MGMTMTITNAYDYLPLENDIHKLSETCTLPLAISWSSRSNRIYIDENKQNAYVGQSSCTIRRRARQPPH